MIGLLESLDRRIVLFVFGLLVAGTILVFGASAYELQLDHQAPYAKVLAHVQKIVLALAVCVVMAVVPYRQVARLAVWGLALSIVGLILLLLPLPFVVESNGIARWIDLGPLVVQPSEFAKLSLALALPYWIDREPTRLRKGLRAPLQLVAPYVLVAALLAAQPNFGSIVAIGLVVVGVLWVGGLSPRIFLFGGSLATAAAWFGFTHIDKLATRLQAWKLLFFQETFVEETGRQAFQAQMGLGNGGWLGAAAGTGVTRYRFVPESDTDFVFAVAGEEWGFIGAVLLVLVFALLIGRCLKIASQCRDGLAYLLSVSIGLMLASYALVNLGMVTGLLPVIGLPLPFLSLGGSALLTNMAAIGVLLNIAAQVQGPRRRQRWAGVKK